jgi:exopolysaccharide production protein ExoQ
MLPTLALLASFAFALWLFARDMRWRRLPSNALWIPAIWLAMGSSRQMSFWFYQLGLSGAMSGGSINLIFNNSLFLAAIVVLCKRRFSWAQYAFANKAVFILYAFFLCSALWSPFPFETLKAVVQQFGWMLVAPIILTERDAGASLRVVFVRVSYVLFPLSIPLMKYFPSIGRQFSYHGSMFWTGVADHKNSLGQLCMVFCLVLIWDLMETRKSLTTTSQTPDSRGRLLNLGIGLYLLVGSLSATAWICSLLCIVLFVVGKRLAGMRNARQVFMLGVLASLVLLSVEQAFDLSTKVSAAFGRGEGMSGRSEIWRVTLDKNTNYLVGWGFQSFWSTDDGIAAYKELGTGPLKTAHNGYIETYLDGGVIGLSLLVLFIWSTGLKATAKLVEGDPMGRLAVVFWPVLLLYNLTESQFMMTGPLWYVMLLTTMDTPWRKKVSEQTTVGERMARQERQPPRQLHGAPAAIAGTAAVDRHIRNREQRSLRSARAQGR